jgi:hypothetical protein
MVERLLDRSVSESFSRAGEKALGWAGTLGTLALIWRGATKQGDVQAAWDAAVASQILVSLARVATTARKNEFHSESGEVSRTGKPLNMTIRRDFLHVPTSGRGNGPESRGLLVGGSGALGLSSGAYRVLRSSHRHSETGQGTALPSATVRSQVAPDRPDNDTFIPALESAYVNVAGRELRGGPSATEGGAGVLW